MPLDHYSTTFQAHSIRVAATSKAFLSCLTVQDILKAADWSSQGVFQKFYHKPKYSLAFASTVLTDTVTFIKSYFDVETKHSEVSFSNGSGHAMAASYSWLYKEGEVEISTYTSLVLYLIAGKFGRVGKFCELSIIRQTKTTQISTYN